MKSRAAQKKERMEEMSGNREILGEERKVSVGQKRREVVGSGVERGGVVRERN